MKCIVPGGAGFVFSGENDADIMFNSVMVDFNVIEVTVKGDVRKIFYSLKESLNKKI